MQSKILKKTFLPVLVFVLVILFFGANMKAEEYRLFSPDKKTELIVRVIDKITYTVVHNSKTVISPSPISLTLSSNMVLGRNPVVIDSKRRTVNEEITPVVKQKSKVIIDNFNELIIHFKENYALIFRAYDDGVAYRFVTKFENDITVVSEEVVFNFADDYKIYFPEEESLHTHQERLYKYVKISKITPERFSSIPALVSVHLS